MRHGPVVLPEPDEPEEPSVGVAVQTCTGAVGTRDREADFSDLPDPARGGLGKRRFGNGFDRRCDDDALGIQGSPKLPHPLRGSRRGQSRARHPSNEGFGSSSPGPAPRPERREAGGDGLRRNAGKWLSDGAPARAQDSRRVRPSVRSRVASSNDPSSFEATPVTGRLEPEERRGGARRSLGGTARDRVGFGGLGGACPRSTRSASRPSGRARREVEGTARDAAWQRSRRGRPTLPRVAAQRTMNGAPVRVAGSTRAAPRRGGRARRGRAPDLGSFFPSRLGDDRCGS